MVARDSPRPLWVAKRHNIEVILRFLLSDLPRRHNVQIGAKTLTIPVVSSNVRVEKLDLCKHFVGVARKIGGMAIPSSFAVLRFTNSSRSPSFAPVSMRQHTRQQWQGTAQTHAVGQDEPSISWSSALSAQSHVGKKFLLRRKSRLGRVRGAFRAEGDRRGTLGRRSQKGVSAAYEAASERLTPQTAYLPSGQMRRSSWSLPPRQSGCLRSERSQSQSDPARMGTFDWCIT
jgi:hypothetical protein